LDCTGNQLNGLNLSGCNSLASLVCENNQLTSLTLPTSIKTLWCTGNQLTELDLSGCTSLASLEVGNNNFTSESKIKLPENWANEINNNFFIKLPYI
jgi:Leucine-rich repeat (LRR) protein